MSSPGSVTETSVPARPLPPTSFVGRVREVVELRDLLADPDVRLVTLVGPGGVGKTRLAVQAAAGLATSFADGVFFVSLAELRDPGSLRPAIATALEVRQASG